MKRLRKQIDEFVEELFDEWEISDYFENIGEEAGDFFKNFFRPYKKRPIVRDDKSIEMYGFMHYVRPAYVFAERVDNILKALFGTSIIVSAFVAYLWGFPRLSELLGYLISSIAGRILMIVIGMSYVLIAVWKLIHLRSEE